SAPTRHRSGAARHFCARREWAGVPEIGWGAARRPEARGAVRAGIRLDRGPAVCAGLVLRLVRAEAVQLVREEGRMHGADVGGAGAVSDGRVAGGSTTLVETPRRNVVNARLPVQG